MSKANDPFNFDDLYKQAGVDNLFVKKSMAEQKAMASRPGAATPPRPANGAASFGTSPTHGETPQLVQQQCPRTGIVSSTATSGSSNSLKGLDLDPFASLGGLSKPPPMSKSSPPSVATAVRPPTPSKTVLSPSNHLSAAVSPAAASPAAARSAAIHAFDLEDMFGPSPSSSPQRQQTPSSGTAAVPSSASFDDPFAAFDTVDGAAAAVPATPPAAAEPQSPPGPASQPASDVQQPTSSSTSVPEQRSAANSRAAGAAPTAAKAKPSSAYFTHLEPNQQQRRQQQQQASAEPEGGYNSSSSIRYTAQADMPGSFSSIAAERRHGAAAAGDYVDRYRGVDGSSGAYDLGQVEYCESSGGKGWGGLLKSVTKTAATLGKKGLKAAQAGLAQLESAIENLDRPAGSLSRTYSGNGSSGGGGGDGAGQFVEYDVPAERVLSMAIHISELPSSRQEEALARLPRPVRQRVMALLREQAVLEGEEQLQQQHLPPSAVARGFETGPGPAVFSGGKVIQTREFDLSEHQAATAAAAPRGAGSALASASRSSPAPPAPPAAAADVQPKASPAATSVSAPVVPQVQEDDLLGMSAAPAVVAAAAATPPAASSKVTSVADIDDFFSGGKPAAASSTRASFSSAAAAAAAVPRPQSAGPAGGSGSSSSLSRVLSGSDGQLAELLGGGGRAAAAAGPANSSRMIYLGGLEVLAVDVGTHGDLYADSAADGSEPELRRQLRAARAAEKHAKMKAALAEQQAKEAAEQQRQQQQQAHKQAHKDRIDTWKNKNKGNVRGLLGSLQTVLWEDSGWKTIGMADLLEPGQVRKAWMKANLLVHPDKVRQRNGSDEQVAIADMIFDALKEAWSQFKA